MIIKTDYSTTRVTVTPLEALELIRQLADAVASASTRQRAHSFCTGASVETSSAVGGFFPGVLSVVVDDTEQG
jgi:hypothetical protein